MNPRIEIVIHQMKNNLNEKLSLNGLSSLVDLSPSRLSHLFKAETGVAPIQYLRVLRMKKACELLETTVLTTNEIRRLIGIKDERHFLRDFKRAFGMTPASYRNNHKTNVINGSKNIALPVE